MPTASIRSGMGFKYDSASATELLRQRYGESVVGPKNTRAETKPEVQPVSAAEDIAKKERMLPKQLSLMCPCRQQSLKLY